MDLEDVPITHERTLDRKHYDTRKMEFLKADEKTKVKLEFPIYSDQANTELLLKLIKSFRRTIKSYDLFKHLGEAEVYDRFSQCLDGDAYDTWDAVVEDADKDTWDTNTANFLEILLDEDAYTVQRDYLMKKQVICQRKFDPLD